ncbi:MAG: hypothetical protein M0Z30_02185 [Actinomycetota bacterium]|nr:hypothetical protein [Actinomycetota bacterium]
MRTLARTSGSALAIVGLVAVCSSAGYLLGRGVAPATSSRMFPWIVARATGIGAYLVLAAIAVTGLLFRRPVRPASMVRPETFFRFHVYLAPALMALLVAHVSALLADQWAGVPIRALVVPNGATYRPGAVTYGVIAAYLMLVLVGSAALAGRRPLGRHWVPFHKLAYPAFALVWVHGVLAGSDTARLAWLYVVSGVAVIAAAVWAALRHPLTGTAGVTR